MVTLLECTRELPRKKGLQQFWWRFRQEKTEKEKIVEGGKNKNKMAFIYFTKYTRGLFALAREVIQFFVSGLGQFAK